MPSPFTRQEHQQVIHPLIVQLEKLYQPKKTIIVGIQGGQGTGKTTLVKVLHKELEQKGYHVTHFSIDDFYLSLMERKALQKKYAQNPFYQIPRGLPGTHDLPLLKDVLGLLKQGKRVEIPLFDKSVEQGQGDRSPLTTFIPERQDFILFEGWCVGIPVVSSPTFMRLCAKNKIPLKKIDPLLQYYPVVLRFIKQYQLLWKFLDFTIMLKPKVVKLHFLWRQQQERELKEQRGEGMSSGEIVRFVDLFLPFTYLCYEKLKSNAMILIDEKHVFKRILWKKR